MTKVILKKRYLKGGTIKHYIILNKTTCSLHDLDGRCVNGRIIGIIKNEGTQLLVIDKHKTIYNRNLNDIQNINGKFKEIK